MKFGPVPTHSAQGAILAHSLQLPGGKLRKGLILTDKHIEAAAQAGIADLVVAQLEEGDLHEDAAAATLARHLVPDAALANLRITDPFTGRVNLIADGPGVVQLDVAALEAFNDIHPMITVATVPNFQQMSQGGMIATIKVISYGVPKADVDRACAAAPDAIRLLAPRVPDATLILTDIPGGPKPEKAIAAMTDRVDALGGTMVEVVTVDHRTAPLAEAVAQAKGALVMILTASATSDPGDVAPSAVRAAGGRVDRFGMPVDPGNLLFLGDHNGRPVIGLPGCARSPALNGADWVLSRVMCGVPVTGKDIAGMGVGGLLKEIPTRPQPRSGRKSKG